MTTMVQANMPKCYVIFTLPVFFESKEDP